MFDIYAELKRIINALNENNVEYAVCGGWAMAIHGVPRATVDIDLLISADSLEKVFEIAKVMITGSKVSRCLFMTGK